MDTPDSLHAQMLKNLGDDTLRLVYADALDERGRGDDADRAKLIRLQTALYRGNFNGRPLGCDHAWADCEACEVSRETKGWCVRNLEEDVRKAHPDWEQVLCRECKANGYHRMQTVLAGTHTSRCFVCLGTGDLLHSDCETVGSIASRAAGKRRKIEWDRGFISALTLYPAHVWGRWGDFLPEPTPHAVELVRRIPTLELLRLKDFLPLSYENVMAGSRWSVASRDRRFRWIRQIGMAWGVGVVPSWLFDQLRIGRDEGCLEIREDDSHLSDPSLSYSTEKIAVEAIARTVCLLVKEQSEAMRKADENLSKS